MKEPVREEHRDLVEDRRRTRNGLFRGRRNADDDVAENVTRERAELPFLHGEGEDVRGAIFSTIDFVQLMNAFVVG